MPRAKPADTFARRLRTLWRRIVRRILGGHAEGIAYGYVGYNVD